MPGIVGWGSYVPHWRLSRAEISSFLTGTPSGTGRRSVASYDEDPVTMGVAAARALITAGDEPPSRLLFATTAPPYAVKTNATLLHAALTLPPSCAAFDLGASPRSAFGGLLSAATSTASTLCIAADVCVGPAGSADESTAGDAAAALRFGGDRSTAPPLADVIATASATAEFVDRWRAPGETRTKSWDDRFAQVTYAPLVESAWKSALAKAGAEPGDIARVAVAASSPRLASTLARRLDVEEVVDVQSGTVGIAGAAQPALSLIAVLEASAPDELVAVVSASDGADVLVLRTTDAFSDYAPAVTLQGQAAGGSALPYAKYLAWRHLLDVEPPRRPEPARVSASAAARNTAWKFGLVGSRDRASGAVSLPPSRISPDGRRADDSDAAPMAGARGRVATFTVDRVSYSPSPPIVFAIVDFDDGGRLPVELCDVDEASVAIGMVVETTFRRLGATDGMPNYFYKARPVGDGR